MSPIKDEEAIGRTFILAIKSPIITSALSLLIGGAGGNYFANMGTNAKLEEISKAVHASGPVEERLLFLEETGGNHESRIAKLEQDTVRIPFRRRRS